MSREETRIKLLELIEPFVESKGFEILDLDYYSGRQGKVFLVIDGKDPVTINDCEEISRTVSGLLDLHDPLAHAYLLEVASPGLERPLTKPAHFKKYKGEPVKIILNEEVDGSIKYAGILKESDDLKIIVAKEDGNEIIIYYEMIKKAKLWFKKPDKVRKKTK
ncbi:MAG: ribosome maturation factor RimP [Firmicutes bacterium]|nr:ribosome maturation factor RimP [Bacillota bacterium]